MHSRYRQAPLLTLGLFLGCSAVDTSNPSAEDRDTRSRGGQDAEAPGQRNGDGQVPHDSGQAPPGTNQTCEPVGDLSQRVVQSSIDTDVGVAWNSYVKPLVFAQATAASGWIGWPAADGSVHLTRVDGALQRAGADLTLPFEAVHAMWAHDDGTIAALVSKREGPPPPDSRAQADAPNSAYFVRVSPSGAVLAQTHIVGGSGYVAGAEPVAWFLPRRSSLVFDGSRYGLHFTTAKAFPDGGVHEGDEHVTASSNGALDGPVGTSWIASHGFDLQGMLGPSGQSCTLTLADPFPERALLLRCWPNGAAILPWPAAPIRELANTRNWVAGTLGTARFLDGEYIATVSSWVPGTADSQSGADQSGPKYPQLVRFDATGKLIKSVKLSATPIPEPSYWAYTYFAPFGARTLLAAWAQIGGLYATPKATIGVFDRDGGIVTPPKTMDVPLLHSQDTVSLKNGDVMWLHSPGGNKLGVVRFKAPACTN